MKFKVISYYCDVDDSKYYEKSYSRLKKKLDEYNYDYELDHVESLGSYKENCRRKAQFILDKMEQCEENLLWLDIDTILLNKMEELELLEEDVDLLFASAIPQLAGIKASPIFFKNNKNSKQFLNHWKERIDTTRNEEQECFDHEVLFQTIFDAKKYCKISSLGYNYCTWPGDENENTVILMGLSNVESKKNSLRKMGMTEDKIEWQSIGLYHE